MRGYFPEFLHEVGDLPFIWRPLNEPTNGKDLPDVLPFALIVDKETGVLMQHPNQSVSKALSIAYAKGSMITGMMDDEGIGKQYAEDFVVFLQKVTSRRHFSDVRILEIGCGTGYLLHELQLLGAEVIGIEPGAHGQEGAKKYNVPIIQEFFPSDAIRGRFDVIILYGVIEHVEKSLDFLKSVKGYMDPSGIIALSVPDCEPYIECGDISMLFHQHWSYFTEETLRRKLRRCGLGRMIVQKSLFGGLLYCCARSNGTKTTCEENRFQGSISECFIFRQLAEHNIRRIRDIITDSLHEKLTVGIYVPARAINALSIAKVPLSSIRFFDDNPTLHGTYFPGVGIRIESREDLKNNPTDSVLIMSNSFGERIAKELALILPRETTIKTWKEIFEKPV